MSTASFSYNPDDTIGAFARTVPAGRYTSAKFLDVLKGDEASDTWVTVDQLDVLMLRSVPYIQHAWAQAAGINFGRLAMRHGVIVLNDPNGLAKAMNKLYLQTFPETVRPRTLIARSRDRIEEFARQEGTIILKPLQGARFVEFADLFDPTRGLPVVVVHFLALLELAREGLIEVTQATPYAPIYVRLNYTPS